MAQRTRELEITGIEEFRKMANTLAPRQARNLARATVHGIAGQVRKEMRQRAPKDEGDLRKAIKAVRRRMQGNVAISDVRIEHGQGAKYNAYYYHFVEFGTRQRAATPYIRPTVDEMQSRMPELWANEFGKKLEAALAREAKRQGVR